MAVSRSITKRERFKLGFFISTFIVGLLGLAAMPRIGTPLLLGYVIYLLLLLKMNIMVKL